MHTSKSIINNTAEIQNFKTVCLCYLIVTLLIAWATVGYQAIRVALSNPIETLRYE